MRVLLFVLCIIFLTCAEQSTFDQLLDPLVEDTVQQYNPVVTGALSLVPGGGQIYTKSFTKGGLFLGTELLLGGIAYDRWQKFHDAYKPLYEAKEEYQILSDSLAGMNPDSLGKSDTVNLIRSWDFVNKREFAVEERRIEYYNYAVWFGGVYLWNLIDGVGSSNLFSGAEQPTPRRAALLSAIPFTGAGQFYNGSFFKGAMVSVVEIGCMLSAINFQRLENKAENYGNMLNRELPDSGNYDKDLVNELKYWEDQFGGIQKRKTRFMWYGVFFYLYGIADAAVDAHLHGFERNFDISGNVDLVNDEFTLSFSGEFGKRRVRTD